MAFQALVIDFNVVVAAPLSAGKLEQAARRVGALLLQQQYLVSTRPKIVCGAECVGLRFIFKVRGERSLVRPGPAGQPSTVSQWLTD